ncbi:uncharacterized protein LOC129587165 [Paramacrobiotus metropolitanus]|uniref:uncharacterized protein LOC129587165 n=1 Tax=Paramacrobiotus metropolitanus TaxID=2943436 RepID=UPI00244606ED|nr:uncharacterized protein LOC129587165 [Paramacrobiotus metropolitanus]
MATKKSEKKFNTTIILSISGILSGITCICLETAITVLCARFKDHFEGFAEEQVLCSVSSGIWIGAVFIITGCIGLTGETRRKRPPVGSIPARKSYWGLNTAFLMTSIISCILSVALIGLSSAVAADWLTVAAPSSLFRLGWQLPSSKLPVLIASLAFVLLAAGIISLPVHITAIYVTWKNLRQSQIMENIVFYSGSPSAINLHRSNSSRQIEVITRPASEVFSPVIIHSLSDGAQFAKSDRVIPAIDHTISTEDLSSYF